MKQNPESTWFGTKSVTPDEKTAAVLGVFSSVAARYDVMNDVMSFGMHRLWKDRFVRLVLQGKNRPSAQAGGPVRPETPGPSPKVQCLRIIDVAGGTGDIALRLHKATRGQADITVSDINPDMLAVGQDRAVDRGILPPPAPPVKGEEKDGVRQGGMNWVQGNAEHLPFNDGTFDLYTIAFGLRNVTHIDVALAEAYRLLKPGGRFCCLEFSQVQDKILDTAYQAWSRYVIPNMGAVIASDRNSYQYLVESIRTFPTQALLARRLKTAGFDAVRVVNLTGGIAAIHIAEKF